MEFVNSNFAAQSGKKLQKGPGAVKPKGVKSSRNSVPQNGNGTTTKHYVHHQQSVKIHTSSKNHNNHAKQSVNGAMTMNQFSGLFSSGQLPSNNGLNGQFGMAAAGGNLGALFNGLSIKNQEKMTSLKHHKGARPKNIPPQPSPEELTLRLNTEALLRVDPDFTHLHGSASQVAVYDFDATTNYWTDTKTVGCLFLYSRSVKPEYGLVVLNRKGLKNLVMFFDKHSQIIPQDPYLLFRRGPNEVIKCIWFYKNSEFHAVTELFRTLGVHFDHDDSGNDESTQHLLSESPEANNGQGFNLFDMLKKSQAKIDDVIPAQKPKMMTAEELEQQMFSDADGNSNSQSVESANEDKSDAETNPHEGRLRSLLMSESGASLLKKFSSLPVRNPAVLDRYLDENTRESDGSISPRLNDASRSMRTVEQLEKDFGVVSDKDSVLSKKKINVPPQDISKELLATLGITRETASKSSAPLSTATDDFSPKSPFMTPASRSRSESDRSTRKLTIDDFDGKLYEDTDEEMVREVVDGIPDLTELLLLSENVQGRSEPQLVWRKRSNLQNRPSSALIHPSQSSLRVNHSIQNHALIQEPEISPLTRNQLLQAMTYLLQTDQEFVSKIHEAYVKSLQPSWVNKQ